MRKMKVKRLSEDRLTELRTFESRMEFAKTYYPEVYNLANAILNTESMGPTEMVRKEKAHNTLKEELKKLLDAYILPFGKYRKKNKRFIDIELHDLSSYLSWLESQPERSQMADIAIAHMETYLALPINDVMLF